MKLHIEMRNDASGKSLRITMAPIAWGGVEAGEDLLEAVNYEGVPYWRLAQIFDEARDAMSPAEARRTDLTHGRSFEAGGDGVVFGSEVVVEAPADLEAALLAESASFRKLLPPEREIPGRVCWPSHRFVPQERIDRLRELLDPAPRRIACGAKVNDECFITYSVLEVAPGDRRLIGVERKGLPFGGPDYGASSVLARVLRSEPSPARGEGPWGWASI